MTNKEKIRKEVQRLQDLTMDENKNFYSEAAEGEYNALCNIEHFIDSLQEEPEPQFKVGDTIRNKIWELAVHEIVSMDDSAYYFENGGMVRFDDQKQWELVEEPVSEDLEKAANKYIKGNYSPWLYKAMFDCFKAGAEWDKNQAKVEIQAQSMALAHGCPKKQVSKDLKKELPKVWDRETLDDFAYQVAYDLSNDWMRETPTWDDVETAVKLGAKWQKERKENG